MVELQKLHDLEGHQVACVRKEKNYDYVIYETEIHLIERRQSTFDTLLTKFNHKLGEADKEEAKSVAFRFVRSASKTKEAYTGATSPDFYEVQKLSHYELIAKIFNFSSDEQLNKLMDVEVKKVSKNQQKLPVKKRN